MALYGATVIIIYSVHVFKARFCGLPEPTW